MTTNVVRCVAIGPLAPPVHGAARVNEMMQRVYAEAGWNVRSVNTAGVGSGIRYHLSRLISHMRGGGVLFADVLGACPRRFCYLTLAGGFGLAYQCAVISVARLTGHHVVLHHHSYAYLRARSKLAALTFMVAGKSARHIVLCDDMARKLRGIYNVRRIQVYDNVSLLIASGWCAPSRKPPDGVVTLGHLSNLSIAKGLERVLDTFDEVSRARLDVELVLAGPFRGPTEAMLVRKAISEHAGRIRYEGELTPDRVPAFMARVDVFLFPSEYSHEAAPLAVAEAMAAGARIVSSCHGCLPEMVGDAGVAMAGRGVSTAVLDQINLAARGARDTSRMAYRGDDHKMLIAWLEEDR